MFDVFFLERAEHWRGRFERLPSAWQDVHFHPDFYAAHAAPPDIEAACAVLDDPRGLVLYPFLRNRITDLNLVASSEFLYDIQGVPGYNGLASTSKDIALLSEFHEQFCAYCKSTGIVAELTRLNPALDHADLFTGTMDLRIINRNVIVDLTVSEEDLWHHHYTHAARKQVNKGRRNGIATRLAQSPRDIASFHEVFHHTMVRNDAVPDAFRPLSYFQNLATTCEAQCLFYLAEHKGRPVAVELVTHGTEIGYSFLGGTLEAAFSLAANDILKHEIIIDLKRRGLRKFCLGGGLVPGDGIHRYKQKFSAFGDVDFLLASRIHNRERFQRLVAAWSKAYPERVELGRGRVLPYRY